MNGFRLGLTGSIGMGKSTTAAFFASAGVPVWDADAAVRRLYVADAPGARAIATTWPKAVSSDGVDRTILKRILAADPGAFERLEALIHPLVAADRAAFLAEKEAPLIVLDIPLLFETGADAQMHATLLVTAPPTLQRARVLARPGMTEDVFAAILARQMPDQEKRSRATHIIETLSLDAARAGVGALINYLSEVQDA